MIVNTYRYWCSQRSRTSYRTPSPKFFFVFGSFLKAREAPRGLRKIMMPSHVTHSGRFSSRNFFWSQFLGCSFLDAAKYGFSTSIYLLANNNIMKSQFCRSFSGLQFPLKHADHDDDRTQSSAGVLLVAGCSRSFWVAVFLEACKVQCHKKQREITMTGLTLSGKSKRS
jgi:hypothetical protein